MKGGWGIKQAKRKKGPEIKYLRAPRPTVPWKQQKEPKNGARFGGFMSKFQKEGGEESDEEGGKGPRKDPAVVETRWGCCGTER